jgi:CRISPR/Cas system-associated exonuclease Cas4 (RecB family)
MEIEHISVSRKGVWDTCSCQYRYKYHLKVPSPIEEPFYFTYGKIVHKIAEEYVRGQGEITLKEVCDGVLGGEILIQEYGGELIAAPKLPAEYKKRLPGHLRSIESLENSLEFQGELEVPFDYDLDPPHKRMFVGVIDRLVDRDGKIFILDYKTTKKGKWRKNRKTIKSDLQLRAYARVMQKQRGIKAEDISAALYYVEGGDLIDTQFTEESLESAEQELYNAYLRIEEKDPARAWGTIGRHCDRCEYNSICPFLKTPQLPAALR